MQSKGNSGCDGPFGVALTDFTNLVREYANLTSGSLGPNWEQIEAKLIDIHEWTPDAAHARTDGEAIRMVLLEKRNSLGHRLRTRRR